MYLIRQFLGAVLQYGSMTKNGFLPIIKERLF